MQLACGFKDNHYLEMDCPASFIPRPAFSISLPTPTLNKDASLCNKICPFLSDIITIFLSQAYKPS